MRKLILFSLIFFAGIVYLKANPGIVHRNANPFLPVNIPGQTHDGYLSESRTPDCFILAENGQVAPILIADNDHPGLARIAGFFQNDVYNITGVRPLLLQGSAQGARNVIIAGTVGHSFLIDELVRTGKINISDIQGKREISLKQVVNNPMLGIDRAFVIAGSDKRGTFYGILDLSRNLGVSPWYWWANVPVQSKDEIFIRQGRFITEEPKVKLRGIFINNEAPALSGWAMATFGGFNHKFYERVFELLLRLKGNFLWPAMWGRAFYDDCPHNGALAHEMGIVIGTSHHEPMGRAHVEWARYGSGPWNYLKNQRTLHEFWRTGFERMKNYETIVTLGMRGDGDEPKVRDVMIPLLERIIRNQRNIIRRVSGKRPEEVPQVLTLFKEMQYYYDQGLRVPDDVTILFANDNWGNIRFLPSLDTPERKGGWGMYYHFDYVGGPRNNKWLNVRQVQRIWEQMNLTWKHRVDRIWLVNVGDIKPMEYPITFFLDMAWNPERFNANNLFDHTVAFAYEQFGGNFPVESARFIDTYTKFNARVTPEMLDAETFSLHNYQEFSRVNQEYRNLLLEAFEVYYLMPEKYRDAFDQLVLFPIKAMSNLYQMYYAVARNRYLAAQNNPEANKWADIAEARFNRDTLLTIHFNSVIADGKWQHMMDQVRIGYTTWQQPNRSIMPKVVRVEEPVITRNDKVYVESDGFVSIAAKNFNRSVSPENIQWTIIPNLGFTGSAVTTMPANAYPAENDMVYLEYDIYFETAGEFEVTVLVSPTLPFNKRGGLRYAYFGVTAHLNPADHEIPGGLRYAVSINAGKENIVNFNRDFDVATLERWQATNINKTTSNLYVPNPGLHTLRFRVLEPGVVLQKILINTGGLLPTYLGAPESQRKLRRELVAQ